MCQAIPSYLGTVREALNVACEPTSALIEGSEVCQLNQMFEFS